jgi:hypothetical protein
MLLCAKLSRTNPIVGPACSLYKIQCVQIDIGLLPQMQRKTIFAVISPGHPYWPSVRRVDCIHISYGEQRLNIHRSANLFSMGDRNAFLSSLDATHRAALCRKRGGEMLFADGITLDPKHRSFLLIEVFLLYGILHLQEDMLPSLV